MSETPRASSLPSPRGQPTVSSAEKVPPLKLTKLSQQTAPASPRAETTTTTTTTSAPATPLAERSVRSPDQIQTEIQVITEATQRKETTDTELINRCNTFCDIVQVPDTKFDEGAIRAVRKSVTELRNRSDDAVNSAINLAYGIDSCRVVRHGGNVTLVALEIPDPEGAKLEQQALGNLRGAELSDRIREFNRIIVAGDRRDEYEDTKNKHFDFLIGKLNDGNSSVRRNALHALDVLRLHNRLDDAQKQKLQNSVNELAKTEDDRFVRDNIDKLLDNLYSGSTYSRSAYQEGSARISQPSIELKTTSADTQQANANYDNLKIKFDALTQQLELATKRNEDLVAELEQAKQESISVIADSKHTLINQHEELQNRINKLVEELRTSNNELKKLQEVHAAYREKVEEYRKNNQTSQEKKEAKLSSKLDTQGQLIELQAKELKTQTEQIEELKAKLAKSKKELLSSSDQLEIAKQANDLNLESLEDTQEELNQALTKYAEADGTISKQKTEIKKLEGALEALITETIKPTPAKDKDLKAKLTQKEKELHKAEQEILELKQRELQNKEAAQAERDELIGRIDRLNRERELDDQKRLSQSTINEILTPPGELENLTAEITTLKDQLDESTKVQQELSQELEDLKTEKEKNQTLIYQLTLTNKKFRLAHGILTKKLKILNETLSNSQVENKELDNKLKELQEEHQNLRTERDNLLNEINAAKENSTTTKIENESKINQLNNELLAQKTNNLTLTEEIKGQRNAIQNLKETIIDLKEQLEKATLKIRESKANVQKSNDQVTFAIREAQRANNNRREAEQKLKQLQDENKRLKEESAKASEDLKALQQTNINEGGSKNKLETELNKANKALEQLRTENATVNTDLNEQIETIKRENAELREQLQNLDQLQRQLVKEQTKTKSQEGLIEQLNTRLQSQEDQLQSYNNEVQNMQGKFNQEVTKLNEQFTQEVNKEAEEIARPQIEEAETRANSALEEQRKIQEQMHTLQQELQATKEALASENKQYANLNNNALSKLQAENDALEKNRYNLVLVINILSNQKLMPLRRSLKDFKLGIDMYKDYHQSTTKTLNDEDVKTIENSVTNINQSLTSIRKTLNSVSRQTDAKEFKQFLINQHKTLEENYNKITQYRALATNNKDVLGSLNMKMLALNAFIQTLP